MGYFDGVEVEPIDLVPLVENICSLIVLACLFMKMENINSEH